MKQTVRSKFKNQSEVIMIVAFQMFLLSGAIVKLFSSDTKLTYLIVILFALIVIITTCFILGNFLKSIEISGNTILVRKLFIRSESFKKNEIDGYWIYKTIGALGNEESLYIRLKNGDKIGFHAKAYKNFSAIKKGFIGLGIRNLGDYDYEKTFLKYLKVAIPLSFIISVILFFIAKLV